MKMDQYRLNAYLSNSNEKNDEEKKQPLVHKPVFERISREPSPLEKQKEEEKSLENARLAAETGTWFEKRNVTKDDVLKSTDALIHKGLLKVPEDYVPEKESIYRRVAKFLVVIGMDEAARILPHLSEEQTERIIPEIARIRSVSEEEKKSVLEEFSALLEKSKESGGVEKARDLLVKTYGSEKAEEILSKAVTFPEGNPFDFLKEASAERILLLLRGESDAVKSLVLSQLEPKKAAAIINSMEAKEKSSVILRLSKMQKVSPDVMIQTGKSLHQKLLTQNTETSESLDGKSILAEILRRMTPENEEGIIKTLSDSDPDLGIELRTKLFTQEDIVNADDRYLQKVLYSLPDDDVAHLVSGKSEDFKDKILSNVSKTRRQMILSDIASGRQFFRNDVEHITSSFFATLRRAWERGELRIEGRDDGEVYV